jgi:hypothetical protein
VLFVCCLIVVPLPPGENPFAVNNKIIIIIIIILKSGDSTQTSSITEGSSLPYESMSDKP